MKLGEAIDTIEGCETLRDLRDKLHAIVQGYGFAAFGFLDQGTAVGSVPFWLASSDKAWNGEYAGNDFWEADPVLPVARRSNLPFTWAEVPVQLRLGKRKPRSLRVMEAARDHGLQDGLVVPVHLVDRLGRPMSASTVLYWKDKKPLLPRVSRQTRSELHVIMVYWTQRLNELREQMRHRAEPDLRRNVDFKIPHLTDRERIVMQWAARGKTVIETATILSIAAGTVETHVAKALEKLGAANKTQAAVMAVRLGLIEL